MIGYGKQEKMDLMITQIHENSGEIDLREKTAIRENFKKEVTFKPDRPQNF